jgi:hypothetical protein
MPEYIVWSSRNGWNNRPAGPYRFARDAEHVRRILRAIIGRYPNAEVKVFRIGASDEVTSAFVLGESSV